MWSRKELKSRAKDLLRKIYWSAFGVSIVIALAGGNSGWIRGNSSRFNHSKESFQSMLNDNNFIHVAVLIGMISLVIFAAIMALRIFVGYSLEVGGTRYFVKSAQYKDNRRCFHFGFDGENYMGIVKTMFLTKILIFLWTLLLIIPGIIKAYAYRMVPYILADNPNIGANEAIALSNEMTRGHKLDMFVLDLSFIGWYLLGAITCGIGTLFLMPYVNATNAELYLVLRENALRSGMCSYKDLLLTDQNSDNNDYIY